MKNLFKKLRNPNVSRVVLAVVFALLIFGGFVLYTKMEGRVSIQDSLVAAPEINMTPQTAGQLKKVLVTEGQTVKKGDPLAVVGSDTLYAYTDGIVSTTNQQLGSNVAPSTPVVTLISTTDMRVDGTLDENKGLNKVSVGQAASFTVDALPGRTFWGYVDEVSQTAKTTQAAFSISSERPTQQFDVYVRFNAHDYPEIKNGMSAKVTVYTKTH